LGRGACPDAGSESLFEAGDALSQRCWRGIGVVPCEADQRDLEGDSRVESVLDADERLAKELKGPCGADRAETPGLVSDTVTVGVGEPDQVCSDCSEEDIAQL